MITVEMIDIYDRYDGDPDALGLSGSDEEQMLVSETWDVIADLVQDLILACRVATTTSFEENLDCRLASETIDELAAA